MVLELWSHVPVFSQPVKSFLRREGFPALQTERQACFLFFLLLAWGSRHGRGVHSSASPARRNSLLPKRGRGGKQGRQPTATHTASLREDVEGRTPGRRWRLPGMFLPESQNQSVQNVKFQMQRMPGHGKKRERERERGDAHPENGEGRETECVCSERTIFSGWWGSREYCCRWCRWNRARKGCVKVRRPSSAAASFFSFFFCAVCSCLPGHKASLPSTAHTRQEDGPNQINAPQQEYMCKVLSRFSREVCLQSASLPALSSKCSIIITFLSRGMRSFPPLLHLLSFPYLPAFPLPAATVCLPLPAAAARPGKVIKWQR